MFSLLSRGYFPRELPPTFTTEYLAQVVTRNKSSIPNSFTSGKRIGMLCHHNIPRLGIKRRRFSIPNPVLHYNLCNDITTNWTQLRSIATQSQISRSIPKVGPPSGRAILPYYNFSELRAFRTNLRATARYILKTDIARFYPSIYSHSIPWALHGKSNAKSNRSPSGSLGNSIDRWVRNSQDAQTIGIPIGPDTSLVIAELILCMADQELSNRLPSTRIMRYSDDYEMGFKNYSDAEQALAILQDILKDYELELNSSKTKIIELPVAFESLWVSSLRDFPFRSTNDGQKTDIVRYFDLAISLAKANPDDHVLKYAVQRIHNIKIKHRNWALLQDYLFHCLMVETGTFLVVLSQLIDRHNQAYALDMNSLTEIINYHIIEKCPLGHGSEVAWSVWFAIYLNLTIDEKAAEALSRINDSIVAILALDANNRKLIPKGLDKSYWQEFLSKEGLYGPQWLLAYEANIHGWLKPKNGKDFIKSDSNFSFLRNNSVKFYDPNIAKSLRPTFVSASAGVAPLFSKV